MDLSCYSPRVIQIKDAHADVWKFNMRMHYEQMYSLFRFLTEDETKRYEQLIDTNKKRNNMACRGLLRLVISQYTMEDPGQIQFSYSSQGKPFINRQPICSFNLSHSGNWLYIIVSRHHEVGIDCEMIDHNNIYTLARYILNPLDYARFQDIPNQFKTKRLIQVWTQKEAFIKAIGKGLFYQSLKDIHVDFTYSLNVAISNYYEATNWITKTINIWDDHITSICYKTGDA